MAVKKTLSKVGISARLLPHHAKLIRLIATEIGGNESCLHEALTLLCNHYIESKMPTAVATFPISKAEQLINDRYSSLLPICPENGKEN